MARSCHLCAADDPNTVGNQHVVSLFELGSEQPIKCEFEVNGAPYRPRLNHAAALPPGKFPERQRQAA